MKISIDKKDTLKIKGIAIALIIFHNYFHLTFTKTKENEISFDQNRFSYFLNDFIYTPSEWIQSLLTYFGHFGVQLFIFISAYSLYLSHPKIKSSKSFLLSRIKKIWPMFILSYLAYCFIHGINDGGIYGFTTVLKNSIGDYILLLTGIYPLIPGNSFPIVGPWWFVSFIIQFYVFWALTSRLFNNSSKLTLVTLITSGIILNYTVTPYIQRLFDVKLLLTPIGHIPEIFIGIYFAKYGIVNSRELYFISFITLALSGYYEILWPMHHISALIVFLGISLLIIKKLKTKNEQLTLLWLGTYSLPLFLVNGFLRSPFVKGATESNNYWVEIFYGFMLFSFSCVAAYILTKFQVIMYALLDKLKRSND